MRNIEDVGSDLLHFHNAIQYVGIYKNQDKLICKYFKSKDEELEAESDNLAKDALNRWDSRLSLSKTLGRPLCSFTQYEKAFRMTFYYNDYMILIKTDPTDDYQRLIERIKEKLEEQDLFMHEKAV